MGVGSIDRSITAIWWFGQCYQFSISTAVLLGSGWIFFGLSMWFRSHRRSFFGLPTWPISQFRISVGFRIVDRNYLVDSFSGFGRHLPNFSLAKTELARKRNFVQKIGVQNTRERWQAKMRRKTQPQRQNCGSEKMFRERINFGNVKSTKSIRYHSKSPKKWRTELHPNPTVSLANQCGDRIPDLRKIPSSTSQSFTQVNYHRRIPTC